MDECHATQQEKEGLDRLLNDKADISHAIIAIQDTVFSSIKVLKPSGYNWFCFIELLLSLSFTDEQ